MKESECFPGKRVGKLTLIKKIRLPSGRYTRGGWLCRCDCGNLTKVCDEWKNNYQAFKDWSLSHGFHQTNNPMDMTIDRVDVNGNYGPNNCRWVGTDIQANNKRNSHYIVFHGKKYTVAMLAHKYNLNRATIYWRLKLGWTGDRLVSKPYEYKNIKKVGN